MRLEIRNLQNQETYWVSPEGMIFGREGGPADIRVADQSVSKRHAKVYQRDGTWYLEDLKSVNGTVVNSKRITEPVPLATGFVFALSKHKFEVSRIEGEELATNASLPQRSIEPPPPRETSRSDPGASSSKRRAQAPQGELDDDYDRRQDRPSSAASAGPGGAPEDKGVGYFMIAVPKAVAYYMAAVPLMALNPVGAIKKSVDAMRFQPMHKLELWAYVMPAITGFMLCGVVGSVISQVIAGGFGAIGSAIGSAVVGILVAVVAGIVGGALYGFFGHPITAWIISKLKGDSDDRSRTNYFIAFCTALLLLGAPAALSPIFSSLVGLLASKLGFISILNVVPVVVGVVANLVLCFLAFVWFKHFGVIKWIPILCLVGAAATGVFGALNVVRTVIAAISTIGSGGSGGDVDVAGAEEAAKKAAAAAEEAKKALEEAAASGDAGKIKAAEELQKKLMADAAAAAEAGKKAAAEATAKAEQMQKDAEKAVKDAAEKAEKATDEADKVAKDAAKDAAEKIEKVADVDKPPVSTTTAAASRNAAAYGTFVERKNGIEKAIESDPTLLKGAVEDDYKALLRCLREQDARPDRKSRDYDAALETYYKRKTEAQQFAKCGDVVARLAKKLDL